MKTRFLTVLVLLATVSVFASPEAELFYAEYQTTHQKAKLDAALALDPGNEEYRVAEVRWYQDHPGKSPADLRRIVELTRKFTADFPNTRHWIWSGKFAAAIGNCPAPEAKTIQAEVRDEHQKECRRLMKIDPDAAFRTPEDVKRYDLYTGSVCYFDYYPSMFSTVFIRDRKAYGLDFLKKINAFLAAHPEMTAKVEQIAPSLGIPHFVASGSHAEIYSEERERVLTDYYLSLDDFVAEAERSPLRCVRFQARLLRTVQALVRAGSDEEKVRKIYFDYFTVLDRDYPGFTDGERGPWCNWSYINDLLRGNCLDFWSIRRLKHDENFGCKLLAEYLELRDRALSPGTVRALLVAAKREDDRATLNSLLAAAPAIRQSGYTFLTDRNSAYLFANFIDHFFSNRSRISPETRTELPAALNAPLACCEIRTGRLLAAAQSGSLLYLMGCDFKRNVFLLYELNCDNGALELLSEFPCGDSNIYRDTLLTEKIRFLAATPDYFVFAGPNFLWVGHRKEKIEWRKIEDLPPDLNPSGMAVLNGRIYLLRSGNRSRSGDAKMLLSMDENGEHRKIHFSTWKTDCMTPLDSQPPGVAAGLFPWQGNSLLFAFFGDRQTELWHFRPDSSVFRRVAVLSPGPNGQFLCDGGKAWFVVGVFGNSVCDVDPDTGEVEYFLRGKGGIWNGPHARYEIPGDCEISGPLRVRKNCLWLGGSMQFCVDLDHPQRSQILALPQSFEVFESGGRILFVTRNAVWIVTPKKEGKNPDDRSVSPDVPPGT